MEVEIPTKEEVVNLVREELETSDFTTVAYLRDQLENLPSTYEGCCSFGEAFYDAVKTVLDYYLENDGLNAIIDRYVERQREAGLVTIPGIDS